MNTYYVDCLPVMNNRYRGIDRPWDFDSLVTKMSYTERQKLGDLLQKYSDVALEEDTLEKVGEMISLRNCFRVLGIVCEVIISSPEEIKHFDSYNLSFLGIDITNQFGESLLLEVSGYPSNNNGLLEEQNVLKTIHLWNGENAHLWNKEYIYLAEE